MAWIKKSEYEAYCKNLDPYLVRLGAAQIMADNDPHAPGYVWVGIVKFPSGLMLDTSPGNDCLILHLWGEMDIPFRGFKDAALAALNAAEQCGYFVGVDKTYRKIEVMDGSKNRHHIIHFEDDLIVDVTEVKEE